jgi:hypothetical protein
MNSETLGQLVRKTWIAWAKEQPNPKPSWLVEWDALPESDKEVDRRIGQAIYSLAIADAESVPQDMRGEGENDLRCVAARIRGLKDEAA